HGWTGATNTRTINPITLTMNANKTVTARFLPIGFVWTNLAGGDWDVPTNWTPNLVPGSNDSDDSVIITISVTVTLNTPADCADFTLGSSSGSPTLAGS